MNKIYFVSFLFYFSFWGKLHSQTAFNCGTKNIRASFNNKLPNALPEPLITFEEKKQHSKKAQESIYKQNQYFKYITSEVSLPVELFIYATDNPEDDVSKITKEDVQEIINKLSKVYSPIKVNFLLQGVHFLKTFQSIFYSKEVKRLPKILDRIPIHIYKDVEGVSAGMASFPNDKETYIVLEASELRDPHLSSLIHELGHFLGLPHTFDKRTNKGMTAPDLNANYEKNDGAEINKQIETTGAYIDIFGNIYTEKLPVNNYMSYHRIKTEFTPEQFSIMKNVIFLYRKELIQNHREELYADIFHIEETKTFLGLSKICMKNNKNKIVFFVGDESNQWSHRQINDVLRDEKLRKELKKHTVYLYVTNRYTHPNQVREKLPNKQEDFAGDSLWVEFAPLQVHAPQILIFDVFGDPTKPSVSLNKSILGYIKPRNLWKILKSLK